MDIKGVFKYVYVFKMNQTEHKRIKYAQFYSFEICMLRHVAPHYDVVHYHVASYAF